MRNVEAAARDEHLRAAKIRRFCERGWLFLVDFRFRFEAFSVFRLQKRFPQKNRKNARVRKTGSSRPSGNKKQRRFGNLALENPQRREWDADARAGTRPNEVRRRWTLSETNLAGSKCDWGRNCRNFTKRIRNLNPFLTENKYNIFEEIKEENFWGVNLLRKVAETRFKRAENENSRSQIRFGGKEKLELDAFCRVGGFLQTELRWRWIRKCLIGPARCLRNSLFFSSFHSQIRKTIYFYTKWRKLARNMKMSKKETAFRRVF